MEKNHKIKKYKALIKDVKENDFYDIDLTNRVNIYTCPDGHITKTKDVDAGVTPFVHICGECGKIAESSMYRDVAPLIEVSEEWYRPSLEETLKIKDDDELSHVLQGGLLNRKIN